jgi:hypothetical protein
MALNNSNSNSVTLSDPLSASSADVGDISETLDDVSAQWSTFLRREATLAEDLFYQETIVSRDAFRSLTTMFGNEGVSVRQRGPLIVLRLSPAGLEYSVRASGDKRADVKKCAAMAFDALPPKRILQLMTRACLADDYSMAAAPFTAVRREQRRLPSRLTAASPARLTEASNEQLREHLATCAGSDRPVSLQLSTVRGGQLLQQCTVHCGDSQHTCEIVCETARSVERLALVQAIALINKNKPTTATK